MVGNLKVVMVIAPENFRDEEFFDTKKELELRDIKITVASKGTKTATSKFGKTADVDIDIEDLNPDDYDAIIFVGGGGAKIYLDDPHIHEIAKTFWKQGKIIGAICIAPSILANAGLLKDKKATSTNSQEENLREKGAIFTSENVTQDGILITANGPQASPKFGETVANAIFDCHK